MRKRRYSNSNSGFVSTKFSDSDNSDFWSNDLVDSEISASDPNFDVYSDFLPQQNPVTNNPSRAKLSHILIFLLLLILVASNFVASRVVNNTLTWFVLAFSFVAVLVLAFLTLRFFYRLGYKKIAAFLFFPAFTACAFLGANVAAVINDPLIDESLITMMPSKPQFVFYIRGKNGQMFQVFDESERFVPPVEMWESWFSRGTIAIEDQRFESRYEGVIDAIAVVRALKRNLEEWEIKEGASGIEIQTGKLLTGSYKTKSYLQKAGQGLIALRLDQRFPLPPEKFCLYGNIIDFVSEKRGVGAAASDLFGVSDLRKLSISQSALLAAMLKNPGIYNPRTAPQESLKRRDLVLSKMLELGFINEEQYKTALREEIKLAPRVKSNELLVRAATSFHKLGARDIQ